MTPSRSERILARNFAREAVYRRNGEPYTAAINPFACGRPRQIFRKSYESHCAHYARMESMREEMERVYGGGA